MVDVGARPCDNRWREGEEVVGAERPGGGEVMFAAKPPRLLEELVFDNLL